MAPFFLFGILAPAEPFIWRLLHFSATAIIFRYPFLCFWATCEFRCRL